MNKTNGKGRYMYSKICSIIREQLVDANIKEIKPVYDHVLIYV